jgi:hypothetical protein
VLLVILNGGGFGLLFFGVGELNTVLVVEGRVGGTEGGCFRPGVLLAAEGGMSVMVASEVGRRVVEEAEPGLPGMHKRQACLLEPPGIRC